MAFDKMFEHIVFASILIFYIFPFITTIRKELKKEAKEQLVQQKALSDQQKLAQMGELLNNISHQWRQPLSSINSTVASIEKSYYKNELNENILDEKLSKIESTTQFLSNTIEDFRNYFKPNKQKDKFLMSDAVNSAVNILSTLVAKNDIIVDIEVINDKELHLPKGEYIQVVMAILSNAIDQLVENKTTIPTINITIKEEYLDKVFDLDFSTKLEKKGTGLGMYMAKMLVENSFNGSIEVLNDKDGAIFSITC
jgi:signal transduction histidine kinase